MTDEDADVVTVAAAAALLGVTPATLRRRVMRGTIPGHRDAANRLTLRRSEIAADREGNGNASGPAPSAAAAAWLPPARLTPEQRERGLRALARLREIQAELLAERGGDRLRPRRWSCSTRSAKNEPATSGDRG